MCGLIAWIKKHLVSFIIKIIYVLILYSILLTNNLVNRQDGIWNAATYRAADWELSIGRWALRYVDILRFGITINPWTSILSLIVFVLGVEIIIDIFKVGIRTVENYIGSMLFLSNMIICNVLSYSFTSNAYALAFFLSALSVKLISDTDSIKGYRRIFLSSACIGIMMGLYQNYLGCVCLLVLFLLINKLIENDIVSIRSIVCCSIMSAIGGFFFYEIFLKIELAHWNITLSDYLGANDISIRNIIINFPESLKRTYYDFFYQNVIGARFKWNYFRGNYILAMLGIFAICVCVQLFICKKMKILNTILLLIFIFLIPMATNVCVILAPNGSYWEQQTAPIALILPCFIWNFSFNYEEQKRNIRIVKKVVTIVSVLIIWGTAYQVIVDQESMREGINNAVSIGKGALERMFDSDIYDSSLKIAIVGAPFDNQLYYDSGISKNANIYTRVGGYGWWGNAFDLWAWRGIIGNRIGYDLNYCSDQIYNDICRDPRLIAMQSYPESNCVEIIDEVLVIKVADPQ